MKNPVDKRVKLPHDGYLKIFQLESPCLQVISLALKSIDFIIKLRFYTDARTTRIYLDGRVLRPIIKPRPSCGTVHRHTDLSLLKGF